MSFSESLFCFIKINVLQLWLVKHVHIICDLLSSCIVVFIDNYTDQNSRVSEFSSLRKLTKRTNPVFSLKISITIVVYLGFQDICYLGTRAFSPGTSLDGAPGHSYCCDFGSLLLHTIFRRITFSLVSH